MFLNEAVTLRIMINTIIFDLGNVIVNVNWSKFYDKLNYFGEKTDFLEGQIEKTSFRKSFERGEITPKEFYYKVRKALNLNISFDKFKLAYNNIFSLNKEVAELIKKLKSSFRLVLLSNIDILHYQYIKKKYKILDVFDEYVLSCEVGYLKPNPLIFLHAIKKSQALPFNCLYFDDILEFVIAARLMGIRAFQYKNFEKLINDLNKIDIFI